MTGLDTITVNLDLEINAPISDLSLLELCVARHYCHVPQHAQLKSRMAKYFTGLLMFHLLNNAVQKQSRA